jgi:hypothetical protein
MRKKCRRAREDLERAEVGRTSGAATEGLSVQTRGTQKQICCRHLRLSVIRKTDFLALRHLQQRDGKRFVVRADKKLTAFLELESQCLQENWQTRSFTRAVKSVRNVLMSVTADCRAASQSNSPGNRFCQSVCSLRYWSISRAFCHMFSRETPSDSRKCSHKISFLTNWRASVRSTSINCASFMAYGNT